MKKIIIIYGPTGVGKTDISLELAKNYGGEIINCDVGQFYTPLSIGTAKPDLDQVPVKHHLFNIFSTPQNCNVHTYRMLIFKKIAELHKQNILPILVGGSGFYITSLFFPPPEAKRTTKKIEYPEKTWDLLFKIDPTRAREIKPDDTYRIERAFRLLEQGLQPSLYKPCYQQPPFEFILFFLNRSRKELYERINQRTQLMINQGWLAEVEALYETPWHAFLQEKKLIGYDLLLDFLQKEGSLKEVTEKIAQKTRHYAKRQVTFWKMLQQKLAPYVTLPSGVHEISFSDQDGYTRIQSYCDLFLKE